MRTILKLLFLIAACAAFTAAQSGKRGEDSARSRTSKNVKITVADDGATSELLPIPIATDRKETSARFGAMYFGPDSESDISFIILLKGAKDRYSSGESFGVKIIVNGTPMKGDSLRSIESLRELEDQLVFNFHVKEEEVALMSAANTLRMDVYDMNGYQKQDSITLTPTAFSDFKKFSASIFIIKVNSR